MEISFRLATEADLPIINDILVSAYQFKGSRITMLYHYLALQPDGWWLTLADGNPVGFGGAVDYGAFSSVGMFSVYPSMQRRGIGEALTKQVLSWGEAHTSPSMVLEAEELAVSLYARHGFSEEDLTLQMRWNEATLNMQPSSDVEVIQASNIPELVAFDVPYFGTKREKIFTSPLVFTPGRAFVTRNKTRQITGYIFAQQRMLGPWVASKANDAERLLLRALSLSFESSPTISIPATNQIGIQLLRRYNFSERSVTHYMRRGAPVQTQRAMIYAQASPALG